MKIPGQGGFPMGAVEARQSYSTASFLPVFDLRGQEQIMICPRITLFFHVMVCSPFDFRFLIHLPRRHGEENNYISYLFMVFEPGFTRFSGLP